ncbi:CU044_5270 family protein [Nonomuraea sp. NBC_01738]|uniref:CU044_5270 family protein n=1 Tax=Nonomuraea sp. NBC_01738 TaxID=2976003 RepID=UPI002E0E79B0|nr:CU044_5270 family protein [Nonomuraea sp. NBC_01738]
MNPIDDLRAARPAHLGDSPVDEHTRRAELAHAMSQGAPASRRLKISRPVWGLSLAGTAAAVTAVAVLGGGLGGGTAPRAPSVAVATSPVTATTKLSAQEVLLVAASNAEKQPATSGVYWHTESVSRTLMKAVAGYTVADETRSRSWVTANGVWGSTQQLGVRPATDADRQAYEAAGSPKGIEVEVPGKGKITLSTQDRKPYASHLAGKEIFWLGRNVTMADLKGLPEDEAGLKKWLLKHYAGHDTESDRPMGEDAWLFQTTSGLITDMPVSAKVRAAAFRMLAALPSVTTAGEVVDGQGRSGTAVAIESDSQALKGDAKGVLQTRLIIDETSGAALARENVVVTPGGFQKEFEAGTVWNSSWIVKAEWTDSRD